MLAAHGLCAWYACTLHGVRELLGLVQCMRLDCFQNPSTFHMGLRSERAEQHINKIGE
jgi:hypothetical protein